MFIVLFLDFFFFYFYISIEFGLIDIKTFRLYSLCILIDVIME